MVDDFDRHDYYEAFMGGGRRKPSLPVGGPAVTWQLAFWIPRSLALEHDKWVRRIERFIIALYRHLVAEGLAPHTRSFQKATGELYLLNNIYKVGARPRVIPKQVTRYQMFRVRISYGGLPVSISLELHDEYFTLSTLIDLAWPATPNTHKARDADYENIGALADAMNSFVDITARQYAAACHQDSESIKGDSRRSLEGPYRTIYEEVWKIFFARIFQPAHRNSGQNRHSLGNMFADFRGFIVCADDEALSVRPARFKKLPSTAARVGSNTFDALDALRRVDALVPWLKADPAFTSQDDDKDADWTEPVEFTLTKFLDHRVIYGSALGAQLSRRRGVQAPVTNITMARNQARWQLGRLVDRVQTLGTLRLAALYDFQFLIEAGYNLRQIDSKLERLSGRLLPDMLDNHTPEPTETIRAMTTELIRLSRQLTRTGASLKYQMPSIAGGLAHRAERSRYYRLQFERIAKDLREQRIEGFPTYEEATTRRLGGIYELIDMIGGRYARLQSKVELIMQELQTAESLAGQERLAGLQRAAELAFFLGALPYYLASFALMMIPEDFQKAYFVVTLAVCATAATIGAALAWHKQVLSVLTKETAHEIWTCGTDIFWNLRLWCLRKLAVLRPRLADTRHHLLSRGRVLADKMLSAIRTPWRLIGRNNKRSTRQDD